MGAQKSVNYITGSQINAFARPVKLRRRRRQCGPVRLLSSNIKMLLRLELALTCREGVFAEDLSVSVTDELTDKRHRTRGAGKAHVAIDQLAFNRNRLPAEKLIV